MHGAIGTDQVTPLLYYCVFQLLFRLLVFASNSRWTETNSNAWTIALSQSGLRLYFSDTK